MQRFRIFLMLTMLSLAMLLSACGGKKGDVVEIEDELEVVDSEDKGEETGDMPRPDTKTRDAGKYRDFVDNVNTIYFDFDKSNIRGDQVAPLEANARYLLENPSLKILVEGHCDERGTLEYNMALGQRRAASIRKFLISRGVDANRISIVSKGEEEPAVMGHNEAAWAMNRRCEFDPMD